MKISDNNPYKRQLLDQLQVRTVERAGKIARQSVTLTHQGNYLPLSFVKLFRDKDRLSGLPSSACKILVHIALNMEKDGERIKLDRKELGMTKEAYRVALLELMGRGILASEGRRQWYWINLGVLMAGNIAPD